jgi:hypothetical protein
MIDMRGGRASRIDLGGPAGRWGYRPEWQCAGRYEVCADFPECPGGSRPAPAVPIFVCLNGFGQMYYPNSGWWVTQYWRIGYQHRVSPR